MHKDWDITLKLQLKKEKGKTSCSTLIVTLELDPYLGASSPTLHSAVVLAFCSFVPGVGGGGGIALDRPALLNGMGRNKGQVNDDIFLCSLCLPLEVVKKLPQNIAKFDPNVRLSEVLKF